MAYKTGWVKKIIDGVSTKVFAFAHAKTVYTDFANKKTLADKLSEIDGDVADLRGDVDEMNKVVFSKSITISSENTNYFLTILGIGLYYLQAVAKWNGSTYTISHIATVAAAGNGNPIIRLDGNPGLVMEFVSMQNPNASNGDGLGIYSNGAPLTTDITIIKIV